MKPRLSCVGRCGGEAGNGQRMGSVVPRATTQVIPHRRADCREVSSSEAEETGRVNSTGLVFHPETGLLPLCSEHCVRWALLPFTRPLFWS